MNFFPIHVNDALLSISESAAVVRDAGGGGGRGGAGETSYKLKAIVNTIVLLVAGFGIVPS